MHRSTAELEAGLDHIRASPTDHGTLELVVRRPAVDEREVLEVAELAVGNLNNAALIVRVTNQNFERTLQPLDFGLDVLEEYV